MPRLVNRVNTVNPDWALALAICHSQKERLFRNKNGCFCVESLKPL